MDSENQFPPIDFPSADGPSDWSFEFTPSPKQLGNGDNPIYICVVQEDGHMAWSSPIYLVTK